MAEPPQTNTCDVVELWSAIPRRFGVQKCQSTSRHGPVDCRHIDLVTCDSSCLSPRTSGVIDRAKKGYGSDFRSLPGQLKKCFPRRRAAKVEAGGNP